VPAAPDHRARAPEPSLAERARTLVEGCTSAVLATLDPVTFAPHAAPVPVTVDGAGHPVLVLPNLHPHVSHAWREARAGMALGTVNAAPPTTRLPAVSLTGTLQPVPGFQQLDLEPRFLAAHAHARDQVISLDCSWFRLDVEAVHVDAGGARHGWVSLHDYHGAEPDPVVPHTDDLLHRLRDFDLLDLAKGLTGRINARALEVLDLDRYGCEVRLAVEVVHGPTSVDVRLPFPERLDGPAELIPTVVLMIANLQPREIPGVLRAESNPAAITQPGWTGAADSPGTSR
jgi:hypothetical protein